MICGLYLMQGCHTSSRYNTPLRIYKPLHRSRKQHTIAKGIEKEFMLGDIKNQKLYFLLAGIAFFTILRIATPFRSGYKGSFLDIFLPCIDGLRYIFIIGCVTLAIASKLNRRHNVLVFLLVVLSIAIGLIPTEHFMTIGALLSIHNANPTQIRNDARLLLDEYPAETLFSGNKNQRTPFNNPIPKNKLPLSLQNENINDVLVLSDYVFLEKFGATALFRGFIVFRKGSDIWKSEKAITLLDGCSYCWKIRVVDGLYWYHAVPGEKETATFAFPLE